MMSDSEKPFSPACERNQAVILEQLRQQLRTSDQHVLEIGSGTGQHAVYLGEKLPDITWQTSDVTDNHAGIRMWLEEVSLPNVKPPIEYQIGHSDWPEINADVVFSANVVHIINEILLETLLKDLGENLVQGNRVMFYGPFKYQGQFTSESNAEFDLWLKEQDPDRGIRDFEFIQTQLEAHDIHLIQDIKMPANNQLLIFEKITNS